ncbi:MAG: hypothetical protein IJ566_07340 [Cardiobacteriaceae bacterium]|nr:hypothetical protein [Cardiobacteriaceae bacterium]
MTKKLIFILSFIFYNNFSFADDSFNSQIISRLERCEQAQNNQKKLLDISKPIYIKEENQLRELTYAEILQKRKEQEEIIQTLCKPIDKQEVSKNQPEIATRIAFSTANSYIGRAKGVQINDSVWLALLRAIQEQNIAEIHTIMRYVMGVGIDEIERFIRIVETDPVKAEAVFNAKRKDNNPSGRWDLVSTESNSSSSNPNNPEGNNKRDSDYNVPPPEPNKVKVRTDSGEELYYKSNPKHTPGNNGYNPKKVGTEPKNSLDLFKKSVKFSGDDARYAVDEYGNVHKFQDTNDGSYHWSASTGDKNYPLEYSKIQHLKAPLKKMGAKF